MQLLRRSLEGPTPCPREPGMVGGLSWLAWLVIANRITMQ